METLFFEPLNEAEKSLDSCLCHIEYSIQCENTQRSAWLRGAVYSYAFKPELLVKGDPNTCCQIPCQVCQPCREAILCASVALRVNWELIWKGPLAGHSLRVSLLFPLQVQNTRLTQLRTVCSFHFTRTAKALVNPRPIGPHAGSLRNTARAELSDGSHQWLLSSCSVMAAGNGILNI